MMITTLMQDSQTQAVVKARILSAKCVRDAISAARVGLERMDNQALGQGREDAGAQLNGESSPSTMNGLDETR
jgi:hypothetical protein